MVRKTFGRLKTKNYNKNKQRWIENITKSTGTLPSDGAMYLFKVAYNAGHKAGRKETLQRRWQSVKDSIRIMLRG